MSEDSNPRRSRDQSANSDADTAVEQRPSSETGPISRADWEQLPSDPDSERDLGYALAPWERFKTLDGTDQVMFLPDDEELLREDAFVVADEDSLVELGQRR